MVCTRSSAATATPPAPAVRVLPVLAHHDIDPIWITCYPDNMPSSRTCELIGAELINIVDLPKDIDLYLVGDREKCRYRLSTDNT